MPHAIKNSSESIHELFSEFPNPDHKNSQNITPLFSRRNRHVMTTMETNRKAYF